MKWNLRHAAAMNKATNKEGKTCDSRGVRGSQVEACQTLPSPGCIYTTFH